MMRKYFFIASLLIATGLNAEGLTIKKDLSHNLWWNAPERPEVTLTVLTDNEAFDGEITVAITPDLKGSGPESTTKFTLTIPGNDSTVIKAPFTAATPGFYRVSVKAEGKELSAFNIGFEPTNIVSLPDSHPDFDEFWTTALAELKATPGNYKMTELTEKSGKERRIYEVEMTSLGGDTIKGALALPRKPGKYPVMIQYIGYGGPARYPNGDNNGDWIEFMPSSRGQFLSESTNKYGDWIRYNLQDPANYYYRGAFMDCVRAIDFVSTLEQADTTRIYAEGGSQGGAYTLAAAALDGRLRAIAPYIPFLTDYRHYFSIVGWPANAVKEEADRLELDEDTVYENLSYFDIKNLARRIKCPVLMGIGLQDPVCPPHSNVASYNLIESPKELIIYPLCRHTVNYSDWIPRRNAFFEKYK